MATARRKGRSKARKPGAPALYRHIDERGAFTPSSKRQPVALERIRIAAFSDLDRQDPAAVVEWFRALREPVDFVLYAGDGTSRFRPANGPNYFELIADCARFGLGAVMGNDWTGWIESGRELIQGRRVYELDSAAVILGRYVFVGLDGAPAHRGLVNPHEREGDHPLGFVGSDLIHRYFPPLYQGDVEKWPKELPSDAVFILCSHTPPWGMLDRANSGMHLGWHWLATTIMQAGYERKAPRRRPHVVVCGHVHRQGGQVDHHNGVVVVNAASNSYETDPIRVALFTIYGTRVMRRPGESEWTRPECEWRSVRPVLASWKSERCNEHAWEAHNHHRIPGVQESRTQTLIDAGFMGLADIAYADAEQQRVLVRKLRGMPEAEIRALPSRARAIIEGRPIPLAPFERPRGRCVYIDIETDTMQSWIWAIGCLDASTGELRQFVAKGPSQEQAMLRAFRAYAAARADALWLCYSNCDLEPRVISARLAAHGLAPLPATFLDIYRSVHGAMAFPALEPGLKGIATSLGYQFRHPELDGFMVGLSAPHDDSAAVTRDLLEYNEDDVRSMAFVVDTLGRLCANTGVKAPADAYVTGSVGRSSSGKRRGSRESA